MIAAVPLILLSLSCCVGLPTGNQRVKNNRPIFGIITLEVWNRELDWFSCKVYIGASNVKFLESAGARVTPIPLDLTEHEREIVFKQISGLMLPGGNVILPSKYGDMAKWFIKKAIEANDKGEYFPIIGMCLGYLALFNVTSQDTLPVQVCDGSNIAMNVNFEKGYEKSRFFGSFPKDIIDNLRSQNITYHHHEKCVTPQMIKNNEHLSKFWRILSTNRDKNGLKFISTAEGKKYPFYALAWHPEKVAFEWTSTQSYSEVPHSENAIRMAQRVSNFIVSEARKNSHKYKRQEVESAALVNNFKHMYIRHYPLVYDAIYCIKENHSDGKA